MMDYRVAKGEATEDQVTAAIEKFTSQVPSSIYLAAALASMAVSVGYKVAKKTDMALFIGQWAAPFLILGIYTSWSKFMDRTRLLAKFCPRLKRTAPSAPR